MKLNKILLPVLAGFLFAGAAHAQVNLTITGSTSFRSITFDRVSSLFDAGYSIWGDTTNVGPGTFYGTMSNAIPSLGNTPVTFRCSFSGSGAGMLAVDNDTPITTIDPTTSATNNLAPDIAMSDVFPESATPPINGSDFNQYIVGVIPFVWVVNNHLTGITNITREQAYLLMTASGVQGGFAGMPASYLGGSNTNTVYLTGRNNGSGTYITTLFDIGFYNQVPTEWGTSQTNANLLVLTNGYSSGGLERVVIANQTNVIGYLGVSDAIAIAANANTIAYEGIPFSIGAVQNGAYVMWGYEHLVNKPGGALSANQQLIRNALVSAITNSTYQTTNPLYTNSFVDTARMKVTRGADGGPITSLTF